MIDKWIEDLAAGFWDEAGGKERFPRRLEPTIRLTKPVTIKSLPRLSPCAVHAWLRQHRLVLPWEANERRLNGCILMYQDMGFLFVDERLVAADRAIIIAHEFAHYLAEYDSPRLRARRRLGPGVLGIFNGERSASAAEQVEAALAGVDLGVHVHYMDRTPGSTYSEPVNRVEQTANELALELVAPWRMVVASMRADGPTPASTLPWVERLRDHFDLPECWARPYARRLLDFARSKRTFSETLGL